MIIVDFAHATTKIGPICPDPMVVRCAKSTQAPTFHAFGTPKSDKVGQKMVTAHGKSFWCLSMRDIWGGAGAEYEGASAGQDG